MFLLYFISYYVRDVGVAGSNPVTPTIDFINISYHECVENRHLVPAKTFFGPVLVPLSTLVKHVSSRLSQCDARRRRHPQILKEPSLGAQKDS